jgi:hypothetical protein
MAEAQRAVLTVIDGLSYEAFDHLHLPHLTALREQGAYCRELWHPPPAHPSWFHSCSAGNVALMTGTILWNPGDQQLQSVFASLGPCLHVAGSEAYRSLNVDYHFSALGPYSDRTVLQQALRFLEEVDPAFLRLHLQDPGRAGAQVAQGENSLWSEDSPYPAAVQEADARVGELVAALQAQGRWEETLFVLCGDHGQADTGGHPPLDPKSWRTPLILSGPGVRPGVTLDYAEAIDVAATLCYLFDIPPLAQAQGTVLGELLEEAEDPWPPRPAMLQEINYTLLACESLRHRLQEALTSPERRLGPHLDRAAARARVLFWEADQLYYGLEEMPSWGELGSLPELLLTNLRAYELFCQAEEALSASSLTLPL